jgi:hypothetical protein
MYNKVYNSYIYLYIYLVYMCVWIYIQRICDISYTLEGSHASSHALPLSLSIILPVLELHIDKATHSVFVSDFILLNNVYVRFIHVVAGSSDSFIVMPYSISSYRYITTYLFILVLVDISVVSCFRVVWINLL